jgi:hypothetical protein
MQDQDDVVAMVGVARRAGVDRWFYIGMAACTIIIVVSGFGPSIINPTARQAPLTPLAAAHSLVSMRLCGRTQGCGEKIFFAFAIASA